MKKIMLFAFLAILAWSCDTTNNNLTVEQSIEEDFQWIVDSSNINGSFNPFETVKNPSLSRAKDIDFMDDNELVAMLKINDIIKVFPYNSISRYESINDFIDDVNFAMTYCPQTKSGLVWDRNYNDENFTIKASGYLYKDNLVALDEQSNTYWSQMLATSIKGKYAGEVNITHNFIETTWKTIKDNFGDALVFTQQSNSNNANSKSQNKTDTFEKGEKVFGFIDFKRNDENHVHVFSYDNFENGNQIFAKSVSGKNIITIGNKDLHYITSFYNDENTNFTPINNRFPIVMSDNKGNEWDVFGTAISGPRQGETLKSPVNFAALWWAWESFYTNIVINP